MGFGIENRPATAAGGLRAGRDHRLSLTLGGTVAGVHALWAVPPAVLIAGSLALAAQLRRVEFQVRSLPEAGRLLESDRARLARVRVAAERTRASLDNLEHR